MHRAFPKARDEGEGKKIQSAIDETRVTKFGSPVLSFIVCNYLFANVAEASVVSECGNVTMHIALELYAFYYRVVVRFQTTIEVV